MADPQGLYDAIRTMSHGQLRRGLQKAEGLTEKQVAALERRGRYALRGTGRQIAQASLWFAFGVGVSVVIGVMLIAGYVSYKHVTGMVADGKSGQILSGMGQVFRDMGGIVLGIASTLATQYLRRLRHGKIADE